jgi:drug/metabolite transporter (DMT)-like permease
MSLSHWLLFVFYAMMSTIALLLMKSGLSSPSFHGQLHPMISISFSYRLILGVALYIASFVTWLLIIRHASVVIAYPLSIGLIQLFLMVGSHLFLHSRLTLMTILGSILVLAGVVLLSMGTV